MQIPLDEKDGLVCFCGNSPWQASFAPCDTYGEPLPDWDVYYGLLVCNQCGRIIEGIDMVVVGFHAANTLSGEERLTILLSKADPTL